MKSIYFNLFYSSPSHNRSVHLLTKTHRCLENNEQTNKKKLHKKQLTETCRSSTSWHSRPNIDEFRLRSFCLMLGYSAQPKTSLALSEMILFDFSVEARVPSATSEKLVRKVSLSVCKLFRTNPQECRCIHHHYQSSTMPCWKGFKLTVSFCGGGSGPSHCRLRCEGVSQPLLLCPIFYLP